MSEYFSPAELSSRSSSSSTSSSSTPQKEWLIADESFPPEAKRIRAKVAYRSSASERRRTLLKNLGVVPPYQCTNPANPFQRQLVIEDAARCFVQYTENDALRRPKIGNFTTLFKNSACYKLGEGMNGKVVSVAVCGRRFALKNVTTDCSREDAIASQSELKVTVLEPRIGLFLTRHLLGINCPTLARCPNFVALYAYELTRFLPTIHADRVNESVLNHSYACVQALEQFDLGSPMQLTFSRINSARSDTNVFSSEQLAFSMLAQVLIGLSTIATFGLTHNDLKLANVLAGSMPEQSSIAYEFPAFCGDNDEPCVIAIKTGGVLFALADFGVASVGAWEKYDKRFAEPNLEYGRHATLGSYYFTDQRQRIARKPNMATVDARKEICHPLLIDVDTLERDVSYFLTTVIATSETCEFAATTQRVRDYAIDCMREYNIVGRLRDRSDLLRITKRVLSCDFVEHYFDAPTVATFFATQLAPAQHVYRLPSDTDGMFMELLLEKALCQPVKADCFEKLDTKQLF